MLYTLVSSLLVVASLGAGCKNLTYSSYAQYPIDFCVNYQSAGVDSSSQYMCSSDKSSVSQEFYLKKGCSGTPYTSSDPGAEAFNCDGSLCDNVAKVTFYSGSSCAKTTTYSQLVYVTEYCYDNGGMTSTKLSCSGGNITQWSWYNSNMCQDTANYSYTYYMDGDCSSGAYMVGVMCDASPDGGGSSAFAFTVALSFISSLIAAVIIF
jgi:hypothetical protein